MSEQNLKLVRSFPGTFTQRSIQAASVGLVGTDAGDEDKYTRLSSRNLLTDLLPFQFEQVRRKAFYLWQRNPLAKRILQILVDFCAGDDLVVKIKIMKRAKDGDVEQKDRREAQQIFDDFYEDPINHLDRDMDSIITDYFLNGELSLPVFVNPSNGAVRLGYVAPHNVKDVVGVPGNQREIDTLITWDGINDNSEKKLKVIRWNFDGTPESNPMYGKLDGEALFFQANRVPSQMRGYSLLIDHIDWLDACDQFLFASLQGFDARSRWFLDIEMKGKTEDELNALTFQMPANGATNVHNENVKTEFMSPDLKAADTVTAFNMVHDFIIGTFGLPITWMGKGESTNRATSEALTVPTMRMLQGLQKLVKHLMKFMTQYILQQAEKANKIKLAPDEFYDIEVSTFSLGAKDIETVGTGFANILNALVVAEQQGWISSENAKKIVDGLMTTFGVETEEQETPEEILAKNKDKQDKKAYDGLPAPPQFDKTTNEPAQKGKKE